MAVQLIPQQLYIVVHLAEMAPGIALHAYSLRESQTTKEGNPYTVEGGELPMQRMPSEKNVGESNSRIQRCPNHCNLLVQRKILYSIPPSQYISRKISGGYFRIIEFVAWNFRSKENLYSWKPLPYKICCNIMQNPHFDCYFYAKIYQVLIHEELLRMTSYMIVACYMVLTPIRLWNITLEFSQIP